MIDQWFHIFYILVEKGTPCEMQHGYRQFLLFHFGGELNAPFLSFRDETYLLSVHWLMDYTYWSSRLKVPSSKKMNLSTSWLYG